MATTMSTTTAVTTKAVSQSDKTTVITTKAVSQSDKTTTKASTTKRYPSYDIKQRCSFVALATFNTNPYCIKLMHGDSY